MTQIIHSPEDDKHRRKHPIRSSLLLAILVLTLASLACITSEINLTVTHQDGSVDTLEVVQNQYLTESWITAAKAVNQERKADFVAAGRNTDLEDLLPVKSADLDTLFDTKKLQEQGYELTTSETGYTASKTFTLDQARSGESWTVKIIQNPDHPEQITYRAKITLDLSNLQGSIFELRSQPLPAKPNLAPGSGSGSSGGSYGDLFGLFGATSEAAQQEMAVELWYGQKAMQQSDPIEYALSVELPGAVVLHQLDGQTAGTLEGNRVSLILDEATLMANAGKTLVFHVESILKDCSNACNSAPHLVWDGDEAGVNCSCICEKGFEVIQGENVCVNCIEVCPGRGENLAIDPENCELNQCACMCKDGMEMNNAGTKCITTAEAEAEDRQRTELGGISRVEAGEVFLGFFLGMSEGEINRLPGWYLLTTEERKDLLALVEALGIAVDRSQLVIDLGPEMSTDDRIRLIKEEENRLQQVEDQAIAEVKDQIDDRRTIQSEIIKEIGGQWEKLNHLVKIPDYYEKLWQTTKVLATNYVKGQLNDEVKNRILQQTHGGSPESIEAAAAELIKKIPYLTTNGCVDDYFLYKQYYEEGCPAGCEGDDARIAHETALEQLQKKLENGIYGAGRINWSKPGEAYDRAFWTLNTKLHK